MLETLQDAGEAPTTAAVAAFKELRSTLQQLLDRWIGFKRKDVDALNRQSREAGLPPLTVP